MSEEILVSELFQNLEKLEKEKGYICLVDIITARKAYGKSYSNEEIIDALKSKGLKYIEAEDDDEDFNEEPTEADLTGKTTDDDVLPLLSLIHI